MTIKFYENEEAKQIGAAFAVFTNETIHGEHTDDPIGVLADGALVLLSEFRATLARYNAQFIEVQYA